MDCWAAKLIQQTLTAMELKEISAWAWTSLQSLLVAWELAWKEKEKIEGWSFAW